MKKDQDSFTLKHCTTQRTCKTVVKINHALVQDNGKLIKLNIRRHSCQKCRRLPRCTFKTELKMKKISRKTVLCWKCLKWNQKRNPYTMVLASYVINKECV